MITLEVSHEALIREWKQLSSWIQEARKDIFLQQTISENVSKMGGLVDLVIASIVAPSSRKRRHGLSAIYQAGAKWHFFMPVPSGAFGTE